MGTQYLIMLIVEAIHCDYKIIKYCVPDLGGDLSHTRKIDG